MLCILQLLWFDQSSKSVHSTAVSGHITQVRKKKFIMTLTALHAAQVWTAMTTEHQAELSHMAISEGKKKTWKHSQHGFLSLCTNTQKSTENCQVVLSLLSLRPSLKAKCWQTLPSWMWVSRQQRRWTWLTSPILDLSHLGVALKCDLCLLHGSVEDVYKPVWSNDVPLDYFHFFASTKLEL